MSENYTKGIQRILKYAKEEAIRLGQTYVGSEHLVLGILKDSKGNASVALSIIGCNLNDMRKSLESLIKKTWLARKDKYSIDRSSNPDKSTKKVEMYHIGG